MCAQSTKNHVKCLVSAAMVLTLAGVFIAPTAFARAINRVEARFPALTAIEPVAIVTDNGRHIIATGPIGCTEGQRAYVQVTVTQRATGAVAKGHTRITCTGDIQQWEVHASTQGKETFQEGPATAVALARTTDRGDTDDAHQWLVNITLVGE